MKTTSLWREMLLIAVTVFVSGSGILLYKHLPGWIHAAATPSPPAKPQARPAVAATAQPQSTPQSHDVPPPSVARPASVGQGASVPVAGGSPPKACEAELTAEIEILKDNDDRLHRQFVDTVSGIGSSPACGPRCAGFRRLISANGQQLAEATRELQLCRSGTPTPHVATSQVPKVASKAAAHLQEARAIKSGPTKVSEMGSDDLRWTVDGITSDARAFVHNKNGNSKWPSAGIPLWRRLLAVNTAQGLADDQSARLAAAIDAMLHDGIQYIDQRSNSQDGASVQEVAAELAHATTFLSAHQNQELERIRGKSAADK